MIRSDCTQICPIIGYIYIVYRILNICIALVWLINGLYCKVLRAVPRHEQIVSRILGATHAVLLTRVIGVLEVAMAVWVVSRFAGRWCTILQIMVVSAMNIIEAYLVPDLLLWGYGNLLFAAVFVAIVALNEFVWQSTVANSSGHQNQK